MEAGSSPYVDMDVTDGETYQYQVVAMVDGGEASRSALVEVIGTVTDDPSTITGDTTGAVTEDAADNTAGGSLSISDPDDTPTIEARDHAGTYGALNVLAGGAWTYTLDNADPDTNALDGGDTPDMVTDPFTVTASDGNTQVVTITVTGANDLSTFGGDLTGSITEDADPDTVSGALTVNDPDGDDPSAVVPVNERAGMYGFFSITNAGAWTYDLDNADMDTDTLGSGDSDTDVFRVTSADHQGQNIVITVTGADDPSEFGGVMTGTVEEAGGENNGDAGMPTADGTLTVSDVEVDDDPTIGAQSFPGVYGSLVVEARGPWTYTLDNAAADTDALDWVDSEDETAHRPGLRRQHCERRHHCHRGRRHLHHRRGKHRGGHGRRHAQLHHAQPPHHGRRRRRHAHVDSPERRRRDLRRLLHHRRGRLDLHPGQRRHGY